MNDIQELIDEVYELAGLLELAKSPAAPAEILSLARSKSASLNARILSLQLPAAPAAPAPAQPKIEPSEPSAQPKIDSSDSSDLADKEPSDSSDSSDLADKEPSVKPEVIVPKKPPFSLNDRFLFTRELFGGDRRAFESALTRVASMDSYEEADDYFFYHCGWDRESPVAKDFMAVIQKILPV